MIQQLATVLLGKITDEGMPWIDKTAGLVRPITTKLKGKPQTWPIATDVTDPLACNSEGVPIGAMMPDNKYKSILFIEADGYPTRKDERIGAPSWRAKFRIIVWMNCNRFGGDQACGDIAYENIVSALDGYPFDSPPFLFCFFNVTGGGPVRGSEVFGKYTFNEARSQYLHYPYDYFAMNVEMDFVLPKGCEAELTASDVNC